MTSPPNKNNDGVRRRFPNHHHHDECAICSLVDNNLETTVTRTKDRRKRRAIISSLWSSEERRGCVFAALAGNLIDSGRDRFGEEIQQQRSIEELSEQTHLTIVASSGQRLERITKFGFLVIPIRRERESETNKQTIRQSWRT